MVRGALRIVGLGLIAVLVSFCVHECYVRARGIQVCVRNVDTRPLHAEVVMASSQAKRAQPLGELASGKGACVWVEPVGEASIKLTVTNESGSKSVTLEGYVEPSAHGSMTVDMSASEMRITERNVDYL